MKKRTTTKNTGNRKAGSKPIPRSQTIEPKRKPSLILEALEPRILLSATWVGTDGDDSHDAGNHGDEMHGMGGNDILHGGTGADTIDGGTGNDQLFGDQGNDILISGGGSDHMDGGVGGDTFQFTGAQHGDIVTVVGGNGPDTLDLSAYANSQLHDNGSSINVDLGSGHSFTVNYSEIESIQTHDGTYAPGGIPTNQAPAATDGSVHINEDASGAIHLAGTDPDAGDAVDHYVIDSAPDHGSLLLNGNAVHAGDSVAQADIDAGHLTFTPDANWHGDTSFGFHAHDGDALSANAGSFAIHVDAAIPAPTPVVSAPTSTPDHTTDPVEHDSTPVVHPDAGHSNDHADHGDTVVVHAPLTTEHQPDHDPTPVQPPQGTTDAGDHSQQPDQTPVDDVDHGSNHNPTADTGPSAPSNNGHANFPTVSIDSRDVKWGHDENIAVLDPLQNLTGHVQFSVPHVQPNVEAHSVDLHASVPSDFGAHFVPTAVVELPVPQTIALKAELVAAAPGQTASDVFYEVHAETSGDAHSSRDLHHLDTADPSTHVSRRDLEDDSFALPGGTPSDAKTTAVAEAPDYAALLEPAALGFFTKLWAAMRGIGPARSSDQAATQTERMARKR